MAIAGTGYYLCGNIGAVAGLSAHNALFQTTLQHSLEAKLDGLVDGEEVGRLIRRLNEADRLDCPTSNGISRICQGPHGSGEGDGDWGLCQRLSCNVCTAYTYGCCYCGRSSRDSGKAPLVAVIPCCLQPWPGSFVIDGVKTESGAKANVRGRTQQSA